MKGSLTHYKGDTWHYSIIIGYSNENGIKKPIRKKFTIHADKRTGPNGAEQQAERIWDELKTGNKFWESDILFSDYLNDFLKRGKERWKRQGYIWYEQHIRIHIKPEIGFLKVSEITRGLIIDLLNKKKKHSPFIARHCYSILHAVWQEMVYDNKVKENMIDTIKTPELPHVEHKIWNLEQVKIFLKTVEHYRYHLVYFVLFTTAMRVNEALGLRWRDIDFKNNVILVRHKIEKSGMNPELGTPKTKRSVRTIKMIPTLVKKLKEHKKQQANEKEAAKLLKMDKDYGEEFSDLVFCKLDGGPVDHKYLMKNEFLSTIAKCQKEKETWIPRIRIHDLRHSSATYLLSIGTPLEVVAEILGHSTPTIARVIYIKDDVARQEKVMERVQEDFI
jgi:integrase